ncbi:MAG: uncharacterized protein JWP87_1795 [Labilithrix sp.]|nr:uncharacterized protein [Labilithrix sp.]
MSNVAALLFGLRSRVSRGQYLAWGFALAAAKFAIDTGIVYAFTKKTWSPLGYVLPSVILRNESLGSVPGFMHVLLAVAAMPFLWIGVTMSVRRAADAGASPWLGVAFLVPVFNYVTIAVLAMLPTKRDAKWEPARMTPYRAPGADTAGPPSGVDLPSGVRAALLGLAACIALGLAMLGLSVYGLGTYGVALFFATPFTMGAVSALIYNAAYQRSIWHTLGLALLGTVLTGSCVLLFAIEGVLCLAMAFPIAAALSIVGALLAWVISSSARTGAARNTGAMLMLLPAFAVGEAKLNEPTLRHVTTSIEIDAPPERVWPNVIGFSELPAPPKWIYRLGVAYPMRATIHGTGVGAVRHCEFSTGPFVEPITVWDEPHRLAFDVTSQPPSMTEWSPYESVKAPHLEGYMVSKGGEFRLVPLPGGRTRLEGTTHYTLAIYPEIYWVTYGELLLHGIHTRVLEHIKSLSEK